MNEITTKESTRVGGLENGEVTNSKEDGTKELSASVKAQIERNRQRALMLKQARLIPHPYAKM